MLQLASRSLSTTTEKTLKELQDNVDAKLKFGDKKEEANRLWNSKTSSKKKKDCFDEVKQTLLSMCVSVGICNYCENNEANDIEHIQPKSFYPEKTFVWDNYLLAFKQCNTALKLDKCDVIENGDTIRLERGTQPPTGATFSLINPRIEDPNDFMILNLNSMEFIIHPKVSGSDKLKAESTIDILQLNNRDPLIQSRRSANTYFYDRMDRLVRIRNSKSFQELESVLSPNEKIVNQEISLQQNIENFTSSIQNDIKTHNHPSVWYAIRAITSKSDQQWKEIFRSIPEALIW